MIRGRPALAALAGVLAAAALDGCASPRPRFDDGPVVTHVADVHDVAEPAPFAWWRHPQLLRNFGRDQMRLRLDPVPAGPARDVNRLGEVPSSAWWEAGRAMLPPSRIARGAGGDDPGPEAHRPWAVVGLKSGGRNPGLVFEDASGARWIGKLDKVGAPETASGSGAVANRLFWALGYHVPDDRVVFVDRADLAIAPGATRKTEDGESAPLTPAMIDAVLDEVPSRAPDGRIRLLASRFLPGRPLGGYAYNGTRADDPNDLVDHRDRRSLRALRVFGAWLNHVDLKRDNTLDMWVETEGRQVIRHYLVDFDGCLGGYWAARHEARIGWAYDFDLRELVDGVPRLGLVPRPYERLDAPENATVGLFEAEAYDPESWRANYLNDHVLACRPADAFWAGTVLASLSDDAIRAAAGEARFSDPRASEVLARVLVERKRKTVAWALGRVSPVTGLESPTPTRTADADLVIAARDALAECGLAPIAAWRIDLLDADGGTIAGAIGGADSPTPAASIPAAALAGRDYVVVRWTARDGDGRTLPPTEAHWRRGADGGWRLVGILRDGE